MHILIDARTINSSTGRYIERLLHYLQQIDLTNRYTVLIPTKDKDWWKPVAPNFGVEFADIKQYSIDEQTKLKQLLDKLNPDLVHFCMPQQPAFYSGAHVTTFHDLTLLKTYNSDKNWLVYHVKQLIGRAVFRRVVKTSRFILSPTEFTKNELLKYYNIDSNKVVVAKLAADIFVDKLTPYKHPFKQFILYVGQQADYKNIRRLGDAHQKLLDKYPDLGLILAGRKNQAVLNNERYFINKNYRNILFTDFIPDEQRDWLYTKASAYVFPSLMEGFGLPGLEAMGYGAPVVSSNATCLPEVYGDAAHYFNPLDTNDIVRAIDEVIGDDKLRQQLIKKGYEQIKKYSWKKTAEQTHAVYMKALK